MGMKRICFVFLMVSTAIATGSCHKSPGEKTIVPDKGNRHLGIHITPAQNQEYDSAFARARLAGIDCVPLTIQWTEMEKDGSFDPESLLDNLNNFYGGQPVSLSLCISPTAADRKDVPSDLSTLSFSDPVMINRFNNLLDTVHAHLTSINMRYLLIGNEVDIYFAGHPEEWTDYIDFCRAVRMHAKSLWGDQLMVGAETSLGSLKGMDQTKIDSLHASMDMMCLTYYPLNDDFTMQAVSGVRNDIEQVLSKQAGEKILFQEVGYATDAACGGSETAQSDFVREVFDIWDDHADQMVYVAFLWLNDLSGQQTKAVADFYGLSGTSVEATFSAYISSLGLCNQFGVTKPGFATLVQESAVRGWK
jgi:hypothetical protein